MRAEFKVKVSFPENISEERGVIIKPQDCEFLIKDFPALVKFLQEMNVSGFFKMTIERVNILETSEGVGRNG